MKRVCILLLVLALLCACCACGQTSGGSQPDPEKDPHEVKVGVLFPDNANSTGITHYHLLGLQKAVEQLKLPELLCKYSVTDVSFDPSEPVTATSAQQVEDTQPNEPESYTNKEGQVIVRAEPVKSETPESAVSAAADLIDQGCTVIVAADPIYDELTAFLAQQFDDVTFLQYRGTHTDLANLQSFADDAYEAFYLAGAVAGCEGVKQIGFTARTGSDEEKDCINAFALGVAKTNPKAKIIVRMTQARFDLGRERTLPLQLIEKDKCGLLAQSVFTALPVSVASGAMSEHDALPCIGFGYDMQSDGGERYLCSVVLDFSPYFIGALTTIGDGTFDASPYSGGVREGIAGLSALQTASDDAKQTLQSLTEAYEQNTLQPLKDFKPEKNGYASNVTIR